MNGVCCFEVVTVSRVEQEFRESELSWQRNKGRLAECLHNENTGPQARPHYRSPLNRYRGTGIEMNDHTEDRFQVWRAVQSSNKLCLTLVQLIEAILTEF